MKVQFRCGLFTTMGVLAFSGSVACAGEPPLRLKAGLSKDRATLFVKVKNVSSEHVQIPYYEGNYIFTVDLKSSVKTRSFLIKELWDRNRKRLESRMMADGPPDYRTLESNREEDFRILLDKLYDQNGYLFAGKHESLRLVLHSEYDAKLVVRIPYRGSAGSKLSGEISTEIIVDPQK